MSQQDDFTAAGSGGAAREQIRLALRALYVEGVQTGMEAACEVAVDSCRHAARLISADKGPRAAESERFFDEMWPEPGEETEWPALLYAFAALNAARPDTP